jgi:hypothetical protein
MKTVKTVTLISDGVNRRFFLALETLVQTGRIASLNAFCLEYGLSAPRYREMRLTYGVTPRPALKASRYKAVETEALYYLCDAFSVSAEWLLLGRGKMLRRQGK